MRAMAGTRRRRRRCISPSAAIDKDGKVTAWRFETKAFSKRDTMNNEGEPEYTLAGQLLD